MEKNTLKKLELRTEYVGDRSSVIIRDKSTVGLMGLTNKLLGNILDHPKIWIEIFKTLKKEYVDDLVFVELNLEYTERNINLPIEEEIESIKNQNKNSKLFIENIDENSDSPQLIFSISSFDYLYELIFNYYDEYSMKIFFIAEPFNYKSTKEAFYRFKKYDNYGFNSLKQLNISVMITFSFSGDEMVINASDSDIIHKVLLELGITSTKPAF